MNLPRIFPESTPRAMRISAIVFFIMFELFGLAFSLRALMQSAGAFFLTALCFLLLGIAGIFVIGFFWKIMTKIARQKTFQKIELFFSERGYCPEIPELLKNIMPAPTKHDRVLRTFLLVMGEDYEGAEREIIDINEPSLLRREFAMLMTAKLRLFLMTDRMEKFEHIFENHHEKMEDAYDMLPDYLGEYRAYADDAYQYYMLAAAYAGLCGKDDAEAAYRKKAEFLASNRDESEMQCYTQLLELNALYAAGKNEEAHALEQKLYMLPDTFSPPMTQAQKDMFRTAAEQSRILSAHSAIIRAETSSSAERTLPVPEAENPMLQLFEPM